jgi:hypothetical protein
MVSADASALRSRPLLDRFVICTALASFVIIFCSFAPEPASARCYVTQSNAGSPAPTRNVLRLAGTLVHEC